MISQYNQNMTKTAFGRGFYTSDIAKIKKGKLNAAFELGMAVGRGEIKSKDGARQQLAWEELHFKIASAKKGNRALEIGKELYFKLYEAEKGFTPRFRTASDGLDNHELHSLASGHVPTIVDLGVRFAQGVIMPERVLEQLSAHKAAHGANKNIKMLERHLQGFVAPQPMTPLQRTVNAIFVTPLKGLTEGITKLLPKSLDSQEGAAAFVRAFDPKQAPQSPQGKAFVQAFAPNNRGAK